jgi:2-polyprenyl-3-methyl-5-hydroxy-6-metoxy-1,4-benzoquinol methylase
MYMNPASAPTKLRRSQAYFNEFSLFFYDAVLYGVISKFAWGVSIARLDEHYRRYLSDNHLEVGVGTGFLLNRAPFVSPRPRVGLMDLSQACLDKTRRLVAAYGPICYRQNLLEPIAQPIPPFDSIALNYVMHCVPGSFAEKGIAFAHLAPLLKPGGVLFGSTVLSQGVRKNWLARPFMWLMNALGVFDNRRDNAEELEAALRQHFQIEHFEIVGVTAMFAVRKVS